MEGEGARCGRPGGRAHLSELVFLSESLIRCVVKGCDRFNRPVRRSGKWPLIIQATALRGWFSFGTLVKAFTADEAGLATMRPICSIGLHAEHLNTISLAGDFVYQSL